MKKHVKKLMPSNRLNWPNLHALLRQLALPLLLWGLLLPTTLQSQCTCDGVGSFSVGTSSSSVTTLGASGLPSGSAVNACISIQGKLTITSDYTLDNCDLLMGTAAEIEVAAGKKLTIKNGSLITGCTTMWKGITLKTDAKIDMENSTVRDAQFAVQLTNLADYRLVNNIFDANYVGFHVPAAIIGTNQIQPLGTPSAAFFSGNTFQFTTPYLPPFSGQSPSPGSTPYSGLLLNNVSSFSLGNASNGNVTNTFTGVRIGIVDKGGVLNRYSGLMVNNLSGPTNNSNVVDGTGVYIDRNAGKITVRNSQMTGVRHGVYSFKAKELEILLNNITSTVVGISLNQSLKGALVETNTITSLPNPNAATSSILVAQSSHGTSTHKILTNTLTAEKHGIYLSNSTGKHLVEGNVITLNASLTTPYGIFCNNVTGPTALKGNTISRTSVTPTFNGVGINLTLSPNAHVVNNTVSGTASAKLQIGIVAFDSPNVLYCCNSVTYSNSGVGLVGACGDTKLANTTFGNHTIALSVEYGYMSPQMNTGNDWTGATTTTDAQYLGSTSLIVQSKFTTNQALIPSGYTKIQVPPGVVPSDWFTFQGTDPTCTSQVNCGIPPFVFLNEDPEEESSNNLITQTDLKALEQPTTSDELSLVLHWNAQRYLYQKLEEYPELVNWSSAVSAFHANAASGLVGDFHSIHVGISSLGFPPASLNASYEQVLEDISGTSDVDQLSQLLQELVSIEQQIGTWRANRITELIAELGAVSATELFQQDELDILLIYLQTLVQGIAFTSAQMTTIEALSEECPQVAGKGVYWARMLRQHYDPAWHWPLERCKLVETRSGGKTSPIQAPRSGIVLYPNPAQREFFISLAEPQKEECDVTLYDFSGKVLRALKIQPGEQKICLKTEGLHSGIFTVEVRAAGKVLHTERISILD